MLRINLGFLFDNIQEEALLCCLKTKPTSVGLYKFPPTAPPEVTEIAKDLHGKTMDQDRPRPVVSHLGEVVDATVRFFFEYLDFFPVSFERCPSERMPKEAEDVPMAQKMGNSQCSNQ